MNRLVSAKPKKRGSPGQVARQTQRGQRAPSGSRADLLALQRTVGNRTVRRLLQSTPSSPEQAQTVAPTVNMYQFTAEGQTLTLTEEEYKRELERVNRYLQLSFNLLESEAAYNAAEHQKFLVHTHGVAGRVSDFLAGATPPSVGIWSRLQYAIEAGRRYLEEGKVEVAARRLHYAQQSLRDARREWSAYIQQTTEGAQTAINTLEFTRDISFAIAIGTAAVVTAPAIVGAVVTKAGLTGAAAITATAVGTGAVTTLGGATAGGVLRGASNAAGQAIAGGPVSFSQVKREAAEGAKRGAVDAASTLVGFGAGRALGLGARGMSLGGRVARGALAGSAGGATGGGLEAVLEGKSAGEVLGSTVKGAAAGAIGGGLGGWAGGVSSKTPVRKFLAETATEAVSGAAGAALSGGTPEEIKAAAIASVVAGRATAEARKRRPAGQKIGEGETQFHLAPSGEESMHITGIRRGEGIPKGGMGHVLGDAIIRKMTPAGASKIKKIHYPKVTNRKMMELFSKMKSPQERLRAFRESEQSTFGKMSEKIAEKLDKRVDWDNVEIMPLSDYTYSITVPLIGD